MRVFVSGENRIPEEQAAKLGASVWRGNIDVSARFLRGNRHGEEAATTRKVRLVIASAWTQA